MRAMVVVEPGGVEMLVMRTLPDPKPGPGEIAVAVAFAGVNWGDIQKRQGIYPDPIDYPAVIGLEVSGTIAAVGPGVSGLAPGARIAAITGPRMLGGYGGVCVVPAEYAIPLPDAMPLDLGAAFPAAALTAWHLLSTAAEVGRGTRLLVHAIGGAVGLMLTQLAVERGAVVIGTVGSAAKAGRPLACGAARVIDRSREDFVAAALAATGGEGVDLVIDSLGSDILERSFDALRPFGRVINIGEAAGQPDFDIRRKLYERSTSLAGFEFLHARPGSRRWREGVDAVLARLADGRLVVPIEGIYPLEDAAAAHTRLEGRGASGKLLLQHER